MPGQAAICEDGRVIALEGAEGTDAMIARVAELQDDRTDRCRAEGLRSCQGDEAQTGHARRPSVHRPRDHSNAVSGRDHGVSFLKRFVHSFSIVRKPCKGRQGRHIHSWRPGIGAARNECRLSDCISWLEKPRVMRWAQICWSTSENCMLTLKPLGLGGPKMQAKGLQSVFDNSQIAIMGISGVVRKLPSLLARVRQVAADIIAKKPDVILADRFARFCQTGGQTGEGENAGYTGCEICLSDRLVMAARPRGQK